MAEAAGYLLHFDPMTLGFVALAAFAASLLSGLNGFGGGFVLSIFIAPFIGVQAVVPTMAVVNLIANGTAWWPSASGSTSAPPACSCRPRSRA